MLETLPASDIIALLAVGCSLAILGYFGWRTLITSNLFQQGVKLYQAKDYQGAEAAFRKVIAINSTNDVVRLLLGDILNQKGQIEEAKELFCEVISRSPKNADAYLRLANVLMKQKKPAEAKTNLQQAKDLFQKQRNPQKAQQLEQLLQEISKL